MAQAHSETKPTLTPTLPAREGWWTLFSQSQFQGCWLGPDLVKSITLVQAQFQPRPDDIILATFPKCGTTWLKALAFAIANRSRHPATGDGHPLLTHLPHHLVASLEFPRRYLHPVTELEALPSPRLLCTHLPLALLPSGVSALGCRVVYLCREPKDVLVSTWHYMNKVYHELFTEFDRAFELFCEGVSVYGSIWDHYLGYWKQSLIESDRVLFLKYDEMMADPSKHVKVLAEFIRAPFTCEEESSGIVEQLVRLCSFSNLKDLPVNSSGVTDPIGGLQIENSVYFRTAKVGDWKNHMTEEMAVKLDRVIEEKLKGSGLIF
ncbi:cytosolic sulfotransferase 5-like [Phragmites australis]|uniref:cytosolic sulfotransferase 5-like n=1 Tax=Phragmites australis TaxID=29695 RepID=UPI002D784F21|nr:cytosolic sulfotransferase 5-like [Phragmites australis]